MSPLTDEQRRRVEVNRDLALQKRAAARIERNRLEAVRRRHERPAEELAALQRRLHAMQPPPRYCVQLLARCTVARCTVEEGFFVPTKMQHEAVHEAEAEETTEEEDAHKAAAAGHEAEDEDTTEDEDADDPAAATTAASAAASAGTPAASKP